MKFKTLKDYLASQNIHTESDLKALEESLSMASMTFETVQNQYREWLDEKYCTYQIDSKKYKASEVIEKLSPSKYSTLYSMFLNSNEVIMIGLNTYKCNCFNSSVTSDIKYKCLFHDQLEKGLQS